GDYVGGATAGARAREGGREEGAGLLVPVSVNHFRVFTFLAGDTPLKGELPNGCGLDTFLTSQRGIVLSLALAPPTHHNHHKGEKHRPTGRGSSSDAAASICRRSKPQTGAGTSNGGGGRVCGVGRGGFSGEGPWSSSGRG
ncbi:unnamed protein product, partial [Ectocarpus sp. 12 AP-2014]